MGCTNDGLITTRYRDLLRELIGCTSNNPRFSLTEKATLILYPTPSPQRQHAFDLLSIYPALE